MPYGYLGQNTPNQTINNSGVFSITDVAELKSQGKLGGSLELIAEQNITSSTSAVDFTNLGNYNVHFLTCNNFSSTVDAEALVPFLSNNGGTSFINSGYQFAGQVGDSNGNFSESRSTTASSFPAIGKSGTGTGEHSGSYAYFYNLLDSSKYSFMTTQQIAWNQVPEAEFRFQGGVLTTAETHNAIRLTGGLGNIATLTAKLYGVKQI